MGSLVAKKYPTKLFLKAADHTYVECGSGIKAWGCWGGKTGGAAFNTGSGSTKRADCIAQPDERAGITHYLINGVCHQAANRVLLPAKILVSDARGYGVSSAIFGAYGKHAPFNKYPDVTGDLPECAPAGLKKVGSSGSQVQKAENKHINSIIQAYKKFDHLAASPLESVKFHCDLFDREIKFRLGEDIGIVAKGLRMAKEAAELEHKHLVNTFLNKELAVVEFIKLFNKMTLTFQDNLASALNKTGYKKLLNSDRDERVVLADPDIIKNLYGEKVVAEVYGNL